MSIMAMLFPETNYPFLAHWCKRKLSTYESEYGGERAGVPRGEDIPFRVNKITAAVALLAYGAADHETLTAIARTARTSSALLRVWRTEKRFLALYRRAVWECADDYIHLLAANWEEKRPSPSEEFQKYFGVALQQAILRRLCVDVIHMVPEWMPFGLKPKWLSECTLVGPPLKAHPVFSNDETALLKANAHLLLSSCLIRLGTREPRLAQWFSLMLMRDWTMRNIIKNDLRAAVEKGRKEEALGLIDFVTVGSPIDDVKGFHRLVRPVKTGRTR